MNDVETGLKLLISYNVDLDDAQGYYEFVLGKYIPEMQGMGLEMSEAWHTAFGEYPNRLIGFVSQDGDILRDVLEGETWEELTEELSNHVTELDYKVIPYKLGFQI